MVAKDPVKLTMENAVLMLQNVLIQERIDLQLWDTRRMKNNVELMKNVVKNAQWERSGRAASPKEKLEKSLDELSKIVQDKDATLVDAGHTHVEQALGELRIAVFGF